MNTAYFGILERTSVDSGSPLDPGCGAICLVDAYSSGAELAAELRQRGFQLIHVQSARNIPTNLWRSFRPELFDALLVADDDDHTPITAALLGHKTQAVIVSTEPGISLADRLAARLGLPGNPPETSQLRRNKYAMGEAVRQTGLAAVRQALADSAIAAIDLARGWKTWPLVVKPVNSAGSDGVQFCRNEEDVERAVRAILGRENSLGYVNHQVLIQQRLFGQQYIVNALSVDGEHFITEIWRDDRIEVEGAGTIYDREILLPYAGATQNRLIAYVRAVLTALQVKNGPTHTEIMQTESDPVLIEVGARLQGGIYSPAIIEAIGYSHVTATIRRFVEPKAFAATAKRGYELKRNIMAVNLISSQAGVIVRNQCDELLPRLPSYRATVRVPLVGEPISRTIDLWTKPGHVFLVHESVDQLEKDYRAIREWERQGVLFAVTPS